MINTICTRCSRSPRWCINLWVEFVCIYSTIDIWQKLVQSKLTSFLFHFEKTVNFMCSQNSRVFLTPRQENTWQTYSSMRQSRLRFSVELRSSMLIFNDDLWWSHNSDHFFLYNFEHWTVRIEKIWFAFLVG